MHYDSNQRLREPHDPEKQHKQEVPTLDENNRAPSLSCGDCCGEDQQALLLRIGALAREYRGREGSLIQVLHLAQGIYGYLR